MEQLIEVLIKFCYIADLKLTVNLNNQIDISSIFIEALNKGAITSKDLEELRSIYYK